MKNQSYSTPSLEETPLWRIGLEGQVDETNLRLVDECLSYGLHRAAHELAIRALDDFELALPPIVVEGRQ